MVRKKKSISSVDAWEETAVLIAQEIRDWSEQILEVPSVAHGGLPPCPYARAAWLNENVMVHVTQHLSDVVEVKACFPPTDSLTHVIAVTEYDEYTPEEFNQWVKDQNEAHFGVWIMGFHPEAEDDENIPEYKGLGADDYAIIVMQSLPYLVEASDAIRPSGYYARYSADDLAYINERKGILHAWDKKVNAKAYVEQEEICLSKRINDEEVEH